MSKQPEALRVADAIDPPQIACLPETRACAATELRRLHEVNQELVEALKLALKQNECDMVMTGEECRKAQAAIAKAEGDEK
jgi:hypothetical protein